MLNDNGTHDMTCNMDGIALLLSLVCVHVCIQLPKQQPGFTSQQAQPGTTRLASNTFCQLDCHVIPCDADMAAIT